MNNRNRIRELYMKLYHNENALNDLFEMMDTYKQTRSKDLVSMDKNQRNWYFGQDIVGMTLYTDLFAGNLKKLNQKIDYFNDLGITFLHLMPLLKPRDGENDGGYAVEDYRNIDPRLGSIEDFTRLIKDLRKNNIKVCIDYVINHVAKEHQWAKEALNKDKLKQDYFIMYDTDEMPNRFNRTVPEVLPDKCPGNFTYYPEIKKYVFTSFSDFQWDLNFQNPYVFNGMTDNLLYLANLGVNMIRLDAIPFMWKQVDTSCRNLEPIHDLLRMFNLIKEDVCPSLAILGEAIVEPQEIVKYFGNDSEIECEVMYNANLMVDIYNAFASRDVRLITIDANRFQIPHRGTWMNYVRCHDDIGWGFNEQAIRSFGMEPYSHKQFLIKFYGNEFPGTFSKGEMYQFNPITHDSRTNGTLSSLLGLEKAIESNQVYRRFESIRRINLAHALILTYRGFPLIYSGDEIASLNDQSYKLDPDKMREGRWVHRPFFDWKRSKNKDLMGTVEYDVYQNLKKLIEIRKKLPYLHGQTTQYALDLNNQSVLGIIRQIKTQTFFALFNFSEQTQFIKTDHLRQLFNGMIAIDLVQGRIFNLDEEMIELSPYEYVWCINQKNPKK
jgi:amylosucrase